MFRCGVALGEIALLAAAFVDAVLLGVSRCPVACAPLAASSYCGLKMILDLFNEGESRLVSATLGGNTSFLTLCRATKACGLRASTVASRGEPDRFELDFKLLADWGLLKLCMPNPRNFSLVECGLALLRRMLAVKDNCFLAGAGCEAKSGVA